MPGSALGIDPDRRWSGQDTFYDLAVDVRETELPSLIAEGQLLMVDSEQVKDGGVEVVNVDGVAGDGVSQLIGGTMDMAAPRAATSHPDGIGILVVVAPRIAALVPFASGSLSHGRTAELSTPDHKGVVEEAALPEVPDKSGDGLVDLPALAGQIAEDVSVVVPTLIEKLYESYSPLHQSTGEKAVVGEGGLARSGSIHLMDTLWLAGNIH